MAGYLDLHTHHKNNSPQVLAIESYDLTQPLQADQLAEQGLYALGLHPWHLNTDNFTVSLERLQALASLGQVKMIGECGLDGMRGASLAVQQHAFEQQLLLAAQLQKPVIIHCVKAFDLLLKVKKQHKPQIPLVVHGFNKSPELAQSLYNQGFYLSFGLALLHSKPLLQWLKTFRAPYFLETDDAADIGIAYLYQQLAEVLEIDVPTLQAQQAQNWRLLGLLT